MIVGLAEAALYSSLHLTGPSWNEGLRRRRRAFRPEWKEGPGGQGLLARAPAGQDDFCEYAVYQELAVTLCRANQPGLGRLNWCHLNPGRVPQTAGQ